MALRGENCSSGPAGPGSCPCLCLSDPWVGAYWGCRHEGWKSSPELSIGSAQLLGPVVAVLPPCRKTVPVRALLGSQSCRQGRGEQVAVGAGDVPGLGQPLIHFLVFSPICRGQPGDLQDRLHGPRGASAGGTEGVRGTAHCPAPGPACPRGAWGANHCQRYPVVMGRGRSQRSLLGGEGSLGPWPQGCWGSQGSPWPVRTPRAALPCRRRARRQTSTCGRSRTRSCSRRR